MVSKIVKWEEGAWSLTLFWTGGGANLPQAAKNAKNGRKIMVFVSYCPKSSLKPLLEPVF